MDTLTAGFTEIRDRHLEATDARDLSLWGLRGLAAVDPALSTELRDGVLVLSSAGREIGQRLAGRGPADAAEALTWLLETAWNASPPLRRGGLDGLLQAVFDEIFNHLDPYSRYLSPAAAGTARDRRFGTAGVGLRLEPGPRGVSVAEVLPRGPAEALGLRVGDRLLSVDGTPVEDPAAAAALLEGPPGTGVRLVLLRGRGRRTVTLRRVMLAPVTVHAERRDDLLLLRLSAFSSATQDQLAQALLAGFEREPAPRGIVLDLRGNRGGLVREAVRVAGAFLATGLIARTDGRHPDSRRAWDAPGEDLAQARPIAVLVDGRTASAAEIVAAALADRGRAVVVGSATMGKGLIQILIPLPNGAELSLSWSRILAPSGWPLQALGVIPALCTSGGAEATAQALARLGRGDPPLLPVLERQRAARVPVLTSEVAALRGACPPAEGREADLQAATALLVTPEAYRAALLR
ncbi:S41 family peptidase [Roseomonas sp. BN140053]|uniref:S41 family peptidase n=1 Tax=Roseomonas sp. BN140053 TaxID=3391898 RepID=UPI0039ED5BA3